MNVYLWHFDADEIVRDGWDCIVPTYADGVASVLLTDRPSVEGEQKADTSGEQLLTLEVPDEVFAKYERAAYRIRKSLIPMNTIRDCGRPRIVTDSERVELWELRPWHTPEQREAEQKEDQEALKRFRDRMRKI